MLLLCIFLLSSCGDEGGVTPDPTVTADGGETTASSSPTLSIALEEYVLLRAEEGEIYTSKIALALQSAFSSALNKDVEINTDFEKMYPVVEKEIVLGPTGREGSVYTSTVTEVPAAGTYEIEQLDQRILLHYSDVVGAIAAGEALIKSVVPADTAEQVIEVYQKMLDQVNIWGTAASFKSIFADNMLIQQNKPFTVTGTVTSLALGNTYTGELRLGEDVVQSVPVTSDENGAFAATFDAVAGSYRAYSIHLLAGEKSLVSVENVLFGELWIATGQSNMGYTLLKDANYPDSFVQDEFIRVMKVGRPTDGFSAVSLLESNSISWVRGDSQSSMGSVTAVGYYYCVKLREQLGVPVGMIFYAVGGTPVRSWISPETIANTAELKTGTLGSKYATPETWDPAGYRQASALYNTMVSPSLGLNVAGLLWYQGEQDLGERDAYYTYELDLMYRQYCCEYGFAEYEMPMVMPVIMPYLAKSAPQFYASFTTAIAEYAAEHEMITAISVNDVSPEHKEDNNASHPMTKKPVGERLAAAAMALVYGEKGYASDAPHAERISVSGNVLSVTFADVADGLCTSDGSSVLRGFTICGSDGVYYNAEAKIVGKNQVELTSPSVPNPVSATYCYELLTYTANLGCTYRGKLLYMASPFALDMPANANTTTWLSYADCDLSNIWHLTRDSLHWAIHYDAWWAKQNGTALTVAHDTATKAQGDASLKVIVPSAGDFTVGPTLTGQNNEGLPVNFYDFTTNYSRYGTVTVKVKNATNAPLTVDSLRMGSYSVKLTQGNVLPANSDWVTLTFDLDQLSNAAGTAVGIEKLSVSIYQIILNFNAQGIGSVYVDDMQFLR